MRRAFVGLVAALVVILALDLVGVGLGGQAMAAPKAQVNDPGQRGPFAVGYTSLLLIDPSRVGDASSYNYYPKRPIPVCVWYPVDAASLPPGAPEARYPLDPLYSGLPEVGSSAFEKYGIDRAYQQLPVSGQRPFPLVIFSPGWGASAWQHASFGARLASHGFVVAVPYHFGDQSWGWEPPYDHVAVASYNRPLDVSFVLTDLLARNLAVADLLFGAIKPDQVAAGGWSLGGYASMVLAGGDDSVCDTLYGFDVTDPPAFTCAPSFPDPRIKAIVPLDGSGWILHFDELARITVPACGLSQEWSGLLAGVQSGDLPPGYEAWAARQHAAYQGRPAYRVDVFNTIHASFSDLWEDVQVLVDIGFLPSGAVEYYWNNYFSGVTPSMEVHALIGKYAIAFLKTSLCGEPGYQSFLTPGWALTKERYIEFFVTEKKSPNSIHDDWPGNFIYFPHQPGSAQARGENQAHAAKNPTSILGIPRFPKTR